MKILELMHSLDEAYHRFGDIEINIYDVDGVSHSPKDLTIESEEFIIKCE